MTFQVILTDRALKALRSLPNHVQKRVQRCIDLLAQDPRRPGTKQLIGHPGIRRAHASKDYVILYTIEQAKITVIVLRVENRKDVYRKPVKVDKVMAQVLNHGPSAGRTKPPHLKASMRQVQGADRELAPSPILARLRKKDRALITKRGHPCLP